MRNSGSERAKEEKIVHPIPPLYRADSEILILGSFPSVKSRESAFFYGHPQNRFWKVMAEELSSYLSQIELENNVDEKTAQTKTQKIYNKVIKAKEDYLFSINETNIDRDRYNSKTEESLNVLEKMYKKYIEPSIGRKAVCLPSTSPANAAWSLERLVGAWKAVRE